MWYQGDTENTKEIRGARLYRNWTSKGLSTFQRYFLGTRHSDQEVSGGSPRPDAAPRRARALLSASPWRHFLSDERRRMGAFG